ncbi:PREDICTED: transcription factor bHLH101 isoform X2 [Tarenaya hassleriana]|uniref:transcription factor bHLH101 isoform X2 n=1 Tax=Tarenaya hassleriana TaxID=28532 RepID=UPI00053C61EA|nr:PREDICTED: transcription factor bHLH101 isoform X2 [Tarenaya hassleriana]
MCALTPMFPTRLGWAPMEYPLMSKAESFLGPLNSVAETDQNNCKDAAMKKLSHNASERDRRKKLNSLYSSLRSLLPRSDHTKKLSIPGTVSYVLKYIPELRQEVERMCRKKEQLLKRISRQGPVSSAHEHEQHMQRPTNKDLSPMILTSRLTDTEFAVQIANLNKSQISDTLLGLEESSMEVISVSSSVYSNTRVMHTLHLQMDGDCVVKAEELSDVILALQEKQYQWRQ